MEKHAVAMKSDWNMKYILELLEFAASKKLKPGECVIAISVSLRRARVIDHMLGVYDLPRLDKGEAYDTAMISDFMKKGIGCTVDLGTRAARKLDVAANALRVVEAA